MSTRRCAGTGCTITVFKPRKYCGQCLPSTQNLRATANKPSAEHLVVVGNERGLVKIVATVDPAQYNTGRTRVIYTERHAGHLAAAVRRSFARCSEGAWFDLTRYASDPVQVIKEEIAMLRELSGAA